MTPTINNCFFGFLNEQQEICFINAQGAQHALVIKQDGDKFEVQPDEVFPLYQGEFLLDINQHELVGAHLDNGQELMCLEYVGHEYPTHFKMKEIAVPA
jgi:hypothetical protein